MTDESAPTADNRALALERDRLQRLSYTREGSQDAALLRQLATVIATLEGQRPEAQQQEGQRPEAQQPEVQAYPREGSDIQPSKIFATTTPHSGRHSTAPAEAATVQAARRREVADAASAARIVANRSVNSTMTGGETPSESSTAISIEPRAKVTRGRWKVGLVIAVVAVVGVAAGAGISDFRATFSGDSADATKIRPTSTPTPPWAALDKLDIRKHFDDSQVPLDVPPFSAGEDYDVSSFRHLNETGWSLSMPMPEMYIARNHEKQLCFIAVEDLQAFSQCVADADMPSTGMTLAWATPSTRNSLRWSLRGVEGFFVNGEGFFRS